MKHEKDERSALFEYLDDNDCTIYSYGEAQNEVHELETILAGLQKYDSPDMYAIVGNMLVIIEHFAFDASRETKRKGMERIRKDREAHAKMWADVMNGNIPAVIVTQARETLSLHIWQMNFEKHFGSHYAKIGQYIENAKKAANMEQSIETEEIVTYFYIITQRNHSERKAIIFVGMQTIYTSPLNLVYSCYGTIIQPAAVQAKAKIQHDPAYLPPVHRPTPP